MLDDLKKIHQVDQADMLGDAEKQLAQLEWGFTVSVAQVTEVANIVFVGLGGSTHAAELYKSWPGASVPFEIIRDYSIPHYVNETTLCIVASFSGNTEESLEALDAARKAGAQIAVITAGGELAKRSDCIAKLDASNRQPRIAWLQAFKGLLTILIAYGIEEPKVLTELQVASDQLVDHIQGWRADVPASKNLAKQIARELAGRSVVVYSSIPMYAVADKFKLNINESAKQLAWNNTFPEQNHNELTGWTGQPHEKLFSVLSVRSSFEHPRVAERFEIQDQILSGRRPHPYTLNLVGDALVEQLLYGMVLSDFVSVYLAVLNNVNPAPVPIVDTLKAKLN